MQWFEDRQHDLAHWFITGPEVSAGNQKWEFSPSVRNFERRSVVRSLIFKHPTKRKEFLPTQTFFEQIGNDRPLICIGGLNVLESMELALQTCDAFVSATERLGMPYIFKASFDKANRTSIQSFRGPGIEEGLMMLQRIKQEFGVSVITDVHEPWQAESVAEVADYLQLPAFLARQTDLVVAMAVTGKPVNIKKPQFLSSAQIGHIVEKFEKAGNSRTMICERGTQFGYDNLVVDVLGFRLMREASHDAPLILDVTHALQQRESGAAASGGRRRQFMELARAGVAVGIGGIFMEAHPDPAGARCDGPSAVRTDSIYSILSQLKSLDDVAKSFDVGLTD